MPDESTATIYRRWSERFPEAVPRDRGHILTDDGRVWWYGSVKGMDEKHALCRILWACDEWCEKNGYTICRSGHLTTLCAHDKHAGYVSATDPCPARAAMLAMLALPEKKP